MKKTFLKFNHVTNLLFYYMDIIFVYVTPRPEKARGIQTKLVNLTTNHCLLAFASAKGQGGKVSSLGKVINQRLITKAIASQYLSLCFAQTKVFFEKKNALFETKFQTKAIASQ